MEQGGQRRRGRRAEQGRTPGGSQGQGLRRRDVLGVRQLHAGAEWDVHEVRYVWKYDGVFVRAAAHSNLINYKRLALGEPLLLS